LIDDRSGGKQFVICVWKDPVNEISFLHSGTKESQFSILIYSFKEKEEENIGRLSTEHNISTIDKIEKKQQKHQRQRQPPNTKIWFEL